MTGARDYAVVTAAYWGFTLTDGALRTLVLLHFYRLGHSPFTLAVLFLLYEAAGIAAYHAQEWAEALSELRAARRISGDQANLPVMADCERALGRPEAALRRLRDPAVGRLDRETYVDYGLGNFAWYHGRQAETGVLRLTIRDGEVVRDQWFPARIPIEGGVPQPLERAERPAAVAAWRALREGTGLAEVQRPARPCRVLPRCAVCADDP